MNKEPANRNLLVEGDLKLAICDTGPGLSEEDFERVLKGFIRRQDSELV